MTGRKKLIEQEIARLTDIAHENRLAHYRLQWDKHVPPRYSRAHIDSLSASLKDYLISIANAPNNLSSALMLGGEGRGKTWAVYCLARYLLEQGKLSMKEFTCIPEAHLGSISLSGFDRATKISQLLDACQFLAIENVGMHQVRYSYKDEINASARHLMFFEIMDWAYNTGARIIMTSPLSTHELQNYIGSSAWGRFDGMCNRVITIQGTDKRTLIKARTLDGLKLSE